jgi:hypothetical protein
MASLTLTPAAPWQAAHTVCDLGFAGRDIRGLRGWHDDQNDEQSERFFHGLLLN